MHLETPLSSRPSTPPPPRSPSPPSENPDIVRLHHTHHTHGYLAGITYGKTLHLQSGFDEGYALGGRFGLKIGWVLGALQGLSHIAPAMARGEFERAKRELVFDRVFTEEYFARGGVWLYAIAEQGEEGEGDVTLDRVVEMHPLVKRWVCRVEELARGIGVGVEELELERGVGREVEEGKGEEDRSEVGAEAEAQI